MNETMTVVMNIPGMSATSVAGMPLPLRRSQTEQAMSEVGDKLDPADKAEVEADLQSLKNVIAGCGDEITDSQLADLKAGKEKLMNSAQKLFAKVYEQSQAAGAQQGGAGFDPNAGAGFGGGQAGGGSADDDVVDGDFREV